MSLFHSRKSQPEAAARADHSHASPNTRSRVAFNARQRAFRCPRYWTRLTLSANSAQVPPLGTIHFEVPDGEGLQPRAVLAKDYAHSVTSG
ncbi:hypothetical protein ASPFODRAFT_53848 [Aspergillus luchuensis CBS 106.47]|uniref:Uncharacterized protein n=1 Tax=Aspergillus luchuensis (strain CBS 106.47) TaxID=1137211 RepID=A0A1M3T078_ASPLC|nr:hypothetical protein ASPFODRAFT_53848 [Aspergillus luchuensis CBS 106.47]